MKILSESCCNHDSIKISHLINAYKIINLNTQLSESFQKPYIFE